MVRVIEVADLDTVACKEGNGQGCIEREIFLVSNCSGLHEVEVKQYLKSAAARGA